ncbi:hypothetical protein HX021_02450 [Sphingobacterium sp. N143]|uniref:hypothetical protein n=1 Tax=Sphingobacterium sp. N143 TaxID=2746727 RepID=UPI00257622C9|nr:hypothetical protein [Sphingobacterium sp. N143]MDM1293154.1 hypothetical protein [Sphingobacterium sp. N143]
MKVVYLIAIFTCTFLPFSKAQNELTFDDDFNLWNLQKGHEATIFANTAYIRSRPNLQGQIIDSLSLGNCLTISSEPFKGNRIKNFYAPWYQVTYTKDGEKKSGFIWLGLLALGKQVDADGFVYMYGFERFIKRPDHEADYFLTTIKRLNKEGTLLTSHSFSFVFSGQMATQSKILPAMGLKNVKQILRFEFIAEACGIPTDFTYVAWTGEKFIDLPSRYSIADAGVFYHDEKILFPSEHKKNNQIIYKYIEEGEVIDDNALDPNYNISKKEEQFQWDGNQFNKIDNR